MSRTVAKFVPTIFGGAPSYADKILSMFSASDVGAFWPLTADATDAGPNGFNGSATAVTFNSAAGPKDATAPLFDGSTSFINIYSAALNTAWKAAIAEGTLMIWGKVSNTSTWSEAAIRALISFTAASTNRVRIYKSSSPASRLWSAECVFNNTNDSYYTAMSTGNWFHAAGTWSVSNDRVLGYVDGSLITAAGGTVLGTWAGDLNAALTTIGSSTNVPGEVWPGYLMYALWIKRECSLAEIQAVYNA